MGRSSVHRGHGTTTEFAVSMRRDVSDVLITVSNLQEYDYSLDMWSLGCMFAGMVR